MAVKSWFFRASANADSTAQVRLVSVSRFLATTEVSPDGVGISTTSTPDLVVSFGEVDVLVGAISGAVGVAASTASAFATSCTGAASGVISVAGSGATSVVGSGATSVVGSGATSVAGSGATSVVGSGATSVVGSTSWVGAAAALASSITA